MKPLLSVLLSVYNGEPYIQEAIDSILVQSFTDFELIIIDDKSTDDSLRIIKNNTDKRIICIENHKNLGLVANLKNGVEIAKGKYIARMDADDKCLINRFEKQIYFLENNPDVSILGSSVIFFDKNGYESIGYQPINHDQIKCELLYSFTMLHPSVMMRKERLYEFGLNYDINYIYGEDHDLWVRAIRHVNFANIYEPLLKMREHDTKLTRTYTTKYQEYSNGIRKRQLDELGVLYTVEELIIFNKVSCSHLLKNIAELKDYENILLKIFKCNEKMEIFNQEYLQQNGAKYFHSACYNMLKNNNNQGKYYWKSLIRKYDKISFRFKLGMIYRSILSRTNQI
jgi:glycosyltransferase involved in cell wall biosynthesis